MFTNPFLNIKKEFEFSAESQVVFVSDMFVTDYVGGAELTTQALIDSCPFRVDKIHSKDVTLETLKNGHEKYWIFGNFSQLDHELIPTIVANMNYSVLEYDYKFCRYRSPEKHEFIENSSCNCQEDNHGKLISTLYHGSKSLWFMSERQHSRYVNRFPTLANHECTVLSSVFDDNFFAFVKALRDKHVNTNRSGWIVLGSNSWIKGADAAKNWCEKNSKNFEILWGEPYDKVLEKLATAEGFVYLPTGGDTCPRMVIEAKLLGCKLELNDNVEHAEEIWFNTEDLFDTEAYLYASRERFWSAIKSSMEWRPSISGYTTTKNCIEQGYPWRQCIASMLGFCDEVVVVDGGSVDGTWSELQEWANKLSSAGDSRLKIYQVPRDWEDHRFAVYDGLQKSEARARCTSDFLWQQDADEVVHELDYEKVTNLCRNFPREAVLVSLPVIEYWGSAKKVRCDINPWKWRLSKNIPEITHGIPGALRKTDDEGRLYASLGTDGCDYIFKDSLELVPHATFYTENIHNARMHALSGNPDAHKAYQDWFCNVVDQLPGVHHYSWFNIERKINTYKNYWQKHWESLFDIKQEDTAENNKFFNKPWSEVTDDEIKSMAVKLRDELGGWIFHSRVDFSKPTPHLTIHRDQPKIMVENED